MPPILSAARPHWVWSLSALATLLTILWYRKKRGTLQTVSGGADKIQSDQNGVESDEEAEVLEKSEVDCELPNSENKKEEEEIKKKIDQVNLNETVQTSSTVKEEKEDEEPPRARQENFQIIIKELDPDDQEIIKAIEESVILVEEEAIEGEREPVSVCEVEETSEVEIMFGEKEETMNSPEKLNESDSCLSQNGEENSAVILEKKLAKLELGRECDSNKADGKQGNDNSHMAERDSANNSPSEVMLASPSVSGYSDTHSEGSSDSGKGCSEMLTPSRTPASGNSVSGDLPVTSIYEFVIPQQLVGRLIGRHGSYVNEIKETTHASIYIKRHPDTPKLKICAVEGAQMDIESALDMIRHKFPKKRYPNLTLEQVVIAPEPQLIPIISESMQLYLIEGINNDVLLSSLVSADHFFLQQPTHPTYLSLSRLNSCMNYCYSEPDQPTIPEGVVAGVLCAAPVHNGWYRAQITRMDEENKMCEVKFVDYGGFMTMPLSMLRQIRFDFVNLPFQAAECYLASVKPANEENVWCEKAKKLVEELTFGKVLQAQVYGYAEDGIPLIYLYTVVDDRVVLINEELVNLGYAEWIYSGMDSGKVSECEIDESAPMTVAV